MSGDAEPGDAEPGRRHFRRRGDYLALAVVVLVVAVTTTAVWVTSDIHATTSRTAPLGATPPAAPTRLPPSLAEAWRAPDTAGREPVVAGPSVVTARGNTVVGRDALTGQRRWSYGRDLPLCTVSEAWSKVLAVYRKGDWCSEITSLDPATGRRAAQRNGDAQHGTRLAYDGVYVTTTGRSVLTTFRSDLVQSTVYGAAPDFNNAGRQPRTGCTYGTVAAANSRVGVIEHCGPRSSHPDGGRDRLTVYQPGKDSDRPDVVSSVVLPAAGARLVTMNTEYAAVALPNPARLLVIRQDDGSTAAQYPLDVPAADLATPRRGGIVPVTPGSDATYWYTGSTLVSLSPGDFHPQWTKPGALGAGTVFAGRELVPVRTGLDVVDGRTGRVLGHYPVDRGGYAGPVGLASLGSVVLEHRGRTLVALR